MGRETGRKGREGKRLRTEGINHQREEMSEAVVVRRVEMSVAGYEGGSEEGCDVRGKG